MICSVRTLGISGIQGSAVTAECYISQGLPGFDIVGLPDAAVKEARDRVRAAAKSSGLSFPVSRITVNLAPASQKKAGTHYDLPILLSILAASGSVRRPKSTSAFLGELSLDGTIRPISGVLPMALAAKREGIQALFVPAENAPEATLARGPAVYPIHTVAQLAAGLNGETTLEEEPLWVPSREDTVMPDFKDVLGQENVKRALEVAAAGSHNVLLIGPPGSGKSMLSKRLPSILPDMTWEESLEVSQVYSVVGMLTPSNPLVTQRPFRSPHHTVSNAGLAGGGSNPRPGEISLAHKGVLFLDELGEFEGRAIDAMRQPVEDGFIRLNRNLEEIIFPSEVMIVAAANPCKCGNLWDEKKTCTCSSAQISSHMRKLTGPFADRIDMHVRVAQVAGKDLKEREQKNKGMTSAQMREKVVEARRIQEERYRGMPHRENGWLEESEIIRYCLPDQGGQELLRQAYEKMGLTMRAYWKICKIARTIADLEGKETIGMPEVAEALQFRIMEKEMKRNGA